MPLGGKKDGEESGSRLKDSIAIWTVNIRMGLGAI